MPVEERIGIGKHGALKDVIWWKMKRTEKKREDSAKISELCGVGWCGKGYGKLTKVWEGYKVK